MSKLSTREIECAAMAYFNHRKNIIVPNVSWGLGIHECDLLVVRKPSNYAIEVEIKISKSDLIKDKKKKHKHLSSKIKELWFAIPEHLQPYIDHIPERAGILVFRKEQIKYKEWNTSKKCYVEKKEEYITPTILRKAAVNKNCRKLTEKEVQKVLHLGCMRIQSFLKRQNKYEKENKDLKKKIKSFEKISKSKQA